MSWAAVIGGAASLIGGALAGMGGEEGGGQIGSASVLTPGQGRLLNQLTRILETELGPPGEDVPGASELQQMLFGALSGEDAGGAGGAIQAGSDYLDKLLSYDYDPGAGQEYWEQAFQKPMMQQWEQEIMPSIAEKYAGAGAVSSSGFNRAMGNAAANMQTQLGAQLADILYQGQQAHKQQQLQGAGLSQQMASLLSQAGQTQRNIGLQQWEAQQPWGNPWLNFLNQALGTRAYENYAQSPYQTPGLMGGLGTGLMLSSGQIGKLFSS